VTGASASGWLKYAAADIGYNVFRNPNYKVGPFVGYSYFRQSLNAFGCTQLTTPGSACDPPFPSNKPIISEDETWQSLRVGVSAAATIWNRFEINGDVAYLPYAQYSGLDSHLARPSILYFPQTGTGRGVQTELILTYLMTENLKLGIGGRYWAMWTDGARQGCRGACSGTGDEVNSAPYTADTERFGGFVQASYRFTTQP
jgi:outer membrane protease